jgi:hypothetical protein
MELLRYAPHLKMEKLKVNKFVYEMNLPIRAKVLILMPHTLCESVQREVVFEGEIMGVRPRIVQYTWTLSC